MNQSDEKAIIAMAALQALNLDKDARALARESHFFQSTAPQILYLAATQFRTHAGALAWARSILTGKEDSK